MSDTTPQNYANHRRFDPIFHFFALPVLALIVPIFAIIHIVRHPDLHSGLLLLASLAMAVAVLKIRLYSLTVQNRVITFEERLRYEKLLSGKAKEDALKLSDDQIIGLRFASDGELSELVSAAVTENLNRDAIKKRIKNWRADFRRA